MISGFIKPLSMESLLSPKKWFVINLFAISLEKLVCLINLEALNSTATSKIFLTLIKSIFIKINLKDLISV